MRGPTAAAVETAVNLSNGLLTSAHVSQMCGDISPMTLWRWTRELGFPPPDMVIRRRKFWRRSSVEAWLLQLKGEQTTAPPRALKTAA